MTDYPQSEAEKELESRGRLFRAIAVTAFVCLRCGEEIGRDYDLVRRDTGEPWTDPFKPRDLVGWYFKFHHCSRARFWQKRRAKSTSVKTTYPEDA